MKRFPLNELKLHGHSRVPMITSQDYKTLELDHVKKYRSSKSHRLSQLFTLL